MDKKEKELQKARIKRYKIADVLIFTIALTNLILWLIRANYVIASSESDLAVYVYNNLYQPMYYSLFILPLALAISLVNRKFTFDSFPFLTLKALIINYILIFLLVYYS